MNADMDTLRMKTEEEAKYALDERIFELYDHGLNIIKICERLGTTREYINTLLTHAQIESA